MLESLLKSTSRPPCARDLVRQILTFSRNEPPQRTAVSLAEVVVYDTERLLRVTLPPPLRLHMKLQPACHRCWPMPRRSEQAVLNLCTNAVHAIQGQGTERGSIHGGSRTVHPDQRLGERLGLAPSTMWLRRCATAARAWMRRPWNASLSPFTTACGPGHGLGQLWCMA